MGAWRGKKEPQKIHIIHFAVPNLHWDSVTQQGLAPGWWYSHRERSSYIYTQVLAECRPLHGCWMRQQHPLQLQRAAALCRTSTCMHVGLEGLQNYDIFPAFCVTCLSPQTEEGCFLGNSSVAVAAKTLGAAGGRTLSQRFCPLFQLFHKRFYPNLPAFLSQMCNTIGFIPFISLSSVLWSGRESACAEHASCGLWKPPTHMQRTSLPRFQLGRSKRWFSELAQPGCLRFRLRRSMWAGH